MPPICPMIQLFGNCFGQEASTAKVGTSPAEAARGEEAERCGCDAKEKCGSKTKDRTGAKGRRHHEVLPRFSCGVCRLRPQSIVGRRLSQLVTFVIARRSDEAIHLSPC